MHQQEGNLSLELTERIESTLVEFMRKIDRQLIINAGSSEDELEEVLDQRESNRFFNSMRFLAKITRTFHDVPPVHTFVPFLLGFFLLNEQLQDLSTIVDLA